MAYENYNQPMNNLGNTSYPLTNQSNTSGPLTNQSYTNAPLNNSQQYTGSLNSQQGYAQNPYSQPYGNPYQNNIQVTVNDGSAAWPVKNRVTAGVLALLLGGIGVHKFYLGEAGMGVLYLLFCWTGIPAIAALIEGITYLCETDQVFSAKHHVRIG